MRITKALLHGAYDLPAGPSLTWQQRDYRLPSRLWHHDSLRPLLPQWHRILGRKAQPDLNPVLGPSARAGTAAAGRRPLPGPR